MGTVEEWAAQLDTAIVSAEECSQLLYKPEIRGYIISPVESLEVIQETVAEQNTMGRQLLGIVPGNPIRIVCVELTSSQERTSISQSDVQILQRGTKPTE